MVAQALVCGYRLQERSLLTKQIGGKSAQINRLFSVISGTNTPIESLNKNSAEKSNNKTQIIRTACLP